MTYETYDESRVGETINLHLDPLPRGTLLRGADVVCLGTGMLLVRTSEGKLFHSGGPSFGRITCNSTEPWTEALLKGLQRLGVVTEAQVRQHKDAVKANAKWRRSRNALLSLTQTLSNYGVELTDEQVEAIAAAGNVDRNLAMCLANKLPERGE